MEKGKNYNLVIKGTRIPGAKQLVTGEPAPSMGLFIPIDNHAGVCIDGFKKKLPDGGYTTQYLEDIELHLTAYAFTKENPAGSTHGIKPSLSSEMIQSMLESQVRAIPWVGFATPWSANSKKK